jgi:hypothetical protein
MSLDGVELASFARRAAALLIDGLTVSVVFVLGVIPIALWYKDHQISHHFEFNPFENWYSTLLPVVYCGLLVWLTNGFTLGKWLMGIRIVSLSHEASRYGIRWNERSDTALPYSKPDQDFSSTGCIRTSKPYMTGSRRRSLCVCAGNAPTSPSVSDPRPVFRSPPAFSRC